jgi:hypothetical protein
MEQERVRKGLYRTTNCKCELNMNNKKVYLLLPAYCILLVALACGRQQQTSDAPKNTFTINGNVHELTLNPDPPPDFPEHAGKAEFMSYCGVCHSLKYISIQPNFPAKTWEAEVNKMITKYKAPIDSVNGKKIVDYLVAVKGK